MSRDIVTRVICQMRTCGTSRNAQKISTFMGCSLQNVEAEVVLMVSSQHCTISYMNIVNLNM